LYLTIRHINLSFNYFGNFYRIIVLNQSVINQPAHTNAPVIYTALLPPIIKDGIIQTNEKAQSISGKQDHSSENTIR